jgi:EmrB/QacA subfamily drug resistance transporter
MVRRGVGERTVAARRAGWALTAACAANLMVLLDGSVVNIVLPSIQRDVHGTLAGLQWVVTIYTIPLASVLLTVGHLGDRFGVRRLFLWSLGVFTAASLWCALSPTLPVLLCARAVQGVAAGGALPMTLAIIAQAYPDHAARAKAITMWGAVGAIALVVGPTAGGLLTQAFSWRAVFLINLPVGLATLLVAARHVLPSPPGPAGLNDIAGQLLAVLALGGLVGGLIEGGANGWSAGRTIGLLAVAVVATVAFVLVERRSRAPVLPPEMFAHRAYTAAVGCGMAYQFGSFGLQFMLAIYLQEQWGLDTARTGLLFLPFSVCSVLGVLVLNRGLISRGPKWLLCTGGVIALAGALVLLGVTGTSASWPVFAVGTALVGLGSGMFAPSINAVAMQSLPPGRSGLASGVLNAARQVGMAVGVAILGGFIGLAHPVLGMHVGIACVALCFLAVVVLAARFVRARGRPAGSVSPVVS